MTLRIFMIDDADLDRVATLLAELLPDELAPETRAALERFSEAIDQFDPRELAPEPTPNLFPPPTITGPDGIAWPMRARR